MTLSDIRQLLLEEPSLINEFRTAQDMGFDGDLESFLRFREERAFDMAEGGRIGLQNGGEAEEGDLTYDQVVREIMESYPTGADTQTISRPSPQVEALQNILGPQLATFAGTPIRPGTGGQTIFGDTYGAFTPQAQAQNIIQQQAINQALAQAGVGGQGVFDPTTGELERITGAGQGVAGFQPFLDQAQQAANLAQQAAIQGQGAGATALQNAADQANVAGLAALAGQDVGAAGITAAQSLADRIEAAGIAGQQAAQPFLDRAAQLAEPSAVQDFISPYQQQVIDTTRQELERQLQAQQAQLGAGAGAAFGGGRFGIAQGELAARGAQGIASTLAGLRQQGFQQAQQAAQNALQNQLQLGQAACWSSWSVWCTAIRCWSRSNGTSWSKRRISNASSARSGRTSTITTTTSFTKYWTTRHDRCTTTSFWSRVIRYICCCKSDDSTSSTTTAWIPRRSNNRHGWWNCNAYSLHVYTANGWT
jgi:hypothetical protein